MAATGGLYAQSVTVDQPSLNFTAQYGGAAASKTINIGSTGAAISFFAQSNSSWLKCNPCSGTTPSAVTVTADPTGLQQGPYSATLTVFGGTGNAASVSVTFTVGAIGASPTSLQFAYTIGGTVPGTETITLTGQSVTFTTSVTTTTGGTWLQVTPASGAAPGTVVAQLNSTIVPGLAAATYNGSITITPSSGPAIAIPVTLTVTPAPPVTVSGTSLSLAYQLGGANNSPQILTISTTGTSALSYSLINYTVAANPAGRVWFLLNPASGTIPAGGGTQVTVSYDSTANLPAGTYTGSFVLLVPGGSPTQQTINISLLVSSGPLLQVPSSTLNFLYEVGGPAPAEQSVTPCSTAVACSATSGQPNITVSAAAANNGTWLSVTPASGTTGMPYSVSVTPGNLSVGTYTGTVTVALAGAGNSPQMIPVVLTVADDPLLQTSVSSLSLPFQIGQSAPLTQTIAVTTSTGAQLDYTAVASSAATSNCPSGWLMVGGTTAGPTPGSFTVSVNTTGLTAGTCTGTIAVTGTVPSTGAAAVNSVSIPVTLTVSANPLLTVTLPGNPPAPPVFTAQQGGATTAAQSITLGSTAAGTVLNYSVTFATSNNANWLFVSPQEGTTAAGSNVLTVFAVPGLLSAGMYTGTITITATNPGGPAVNNATSANPTVIPVTFQVTAGTLTLSSNTLTFQQPLGGSAPVAQTVNVTSTGPAFNYTVAVNSNNTVNWLSATPASGSTPGTISVSVDGSKLTAGTYTGSVIVTAPNAGGSPAAIIVTLTVTPGTISAPTTALNFTQVAGGSAPAAQIIAVTGSAGLNFTASAGVTTPSNGTWLTATIGSGTATSGAIPANVLVSVNAGSLPAGTYTGTVTIASTGASGSPINVPVNLTVVAPVTLTASPTSLSYTYVIGTSAPSAQNVQLTASASAQFTATATTSTGGNWLLVTPASGTAGTSAMTISVGINPAALTVAGAYTGTVTFNSSSVLTPAAVNVTLSVVAVPTPVITGIQNVASYTTGAVAPGENIVIYGTGIGPSQLAGLQLTSSGTVATTVSGTQVFFDNNPAPIVYVSANQTSVMVPEQVSGRTTTQITVVNQGVSSLPLTYNVVAATPGIYTQNMAGTGPGSILNQDYSVNGPNKPAAKGSYIQVYLSGTGDTTPALVTGAVNPANGSGLKKSLITYTATVGGIDAPVIYQGTAPGYVEGVMQFNIQIPPAAPSGAQPIVISSGTSTTVLTFTTQPGVTVQVQ